MRIQLKVGLAVLRRGPSTVQIGLDSRHGAVLDGLDEDDARVLHELAGGVDDAALTGPLPADPAEADRAQRVRHLVSALAGTGVLLRSRSGRAALGRVGELRTRLAPDAAAWSLIHPNAGDGWELLAARRRRTVEIHGAGRTGAVLAAALAAAGVGEVPLLDPRPVTPADLVPGGPTPLDLGLPAGQVVRHAVRHALGPGACVPNACGVVPAAGAAVPDLVVLVDRAAADASRADRLVAADVPHLSVVVRETSILVGPLVVPGHGPCLRCLDLHRSDRDRAWPLVLAQLLGHQNHPRAPREETSLAQVAGALAALQVLAHLDGQVAPAAAGATLEVELPDGLVSRRPWPVHHACGCRRLPDTDDETPGQDERTRHGTATMPP